MQSWFGDLVDPGPGRFVGFSIRIPMATAIFRVHTPEGFVIGADGRARKSEDLDAPPNDKMQKIISLGTGVDSLSCCFAGTVKIPADGTAFDLIASVTSAAQSLSTRRGRNLVEYAKRICSRA